MKYLLDTHIFLWWVLDNPKLSEASRARMGRSDSRLFLSAASAWEMAIKAQAGKLELPESVIEFTRKQLLLNDIDSLDVSTEHALTVFNLPLHHKDPFDRLLIAQAMVEDMAIITNDDMIKPYEVRMA
jgi:PIN domain nuclease of toxin-antitoxin system